MSPTICAYLLQGPDGDQIPIRRHGFLSEYIPGDCMTPTKDEACNLKLCNLHARPRRTAQRSNRSFQGNQICPAVLPRHEENCQVSAIQPKFYQINLLRDQEYAIKAPTRDTFGTLKVVWMSQTPQISSTCTDATNAILSPLNHSSTVTYIIYSIRRSRPPRHIVWNGAAIGQRHLGASFEFEGSCAIYLARRNVPNPS